MLKLRHVKIRTLMPIPAHEITRKVSVGSTVDIVNRTQPNKLRMNMEAIGAQHGPFDPMTMSKQQSEKYVRFPTFIFILIINNVVNFIE